jgi:hypothetical protein
VSLFSSSWTHLSYDLGNRYFDLQIDHRVWLVVGCHITNVRMVSITSLLGWFLWGCYCLPTGRYRPGCGWYRPLVSTWSLVWPQVLPPALESVGVVMPGQYRLLLTQAVGSRMTRFDWLSLSSQRHVIYSFLYRLNSKKTKKIKKIQISSPHLKKYVL